MKKEQVIAKLENAWSDFRESYAGMDDTRLLEPGVIEDWSVKDLMAHVSWWEEEALKYLPYALEGKRPPRYKDQYGGIDAFNAKMTELKRGLSLGEVRRYMADTHNKLLAYLQTIPEEPFKTETRFRHRLRMDTFSHYPVHTEAILEWRSKLPYTT
jgi:hypothetical protein